MNVKTARETIQKELDRTNRLYRPYPDPMAYLARRAEALQFALDVLDGT